MESEIERRIRERKFTTEDHLLAWMGFWIAIWGGIVISGAVAGLVLGGIILLAATEPEAMTFSAPLRMALAGGGLAAYVGAGVVACAIFLTLIFRSFHSPKGLAALTGGVTAGLCSSALLILSVVIIPLGALGAWLCVSLYMKTSVAEPMVLFAELREQKWLETQRKAWRD